MNHSDLLREEAIEPAGFELRREGSFSVELSRRGFMQLLGAGLLITVTQDIASARRSGRSQQSIAVAARLHINTDGTITVMTGKVEEGQGARAQLSQAAAEELHVAADKIKLIMADTALVPDDGMTAGSRTTPSTVPAVRRGAAAGRELLINLAAEKWQADSSDLDASDGIITNRKTNKKISYGQLAKEADLGDTLKAGVPSGVTLTAVSKWKVIGTPVPKANLRDLVTGSHRFPSDIIRPDMLYGRVLRPPSYGATLESVDLSKAKAMKDVIVVRDGQFVGCIAPSTLQAANAVAAIAKTASWKTISHVSSKDLYPHLQKNARERGSTDGFDAATKVLSETYNVAFIQHVPMETRAAVAEWQGDELTVWTCVDYPQRGRGDVSQALGVPADKVRVIVPDMGGGFGGKHSAEAAIEAARLAKVAKRPVSVKWTRRDEFTWAYFRPASVIECNGGLDAKGSLVAWDFTNINAGGSGLDCPYDIAHKKTRSVGSDSPLKQGPYRGLASAANNFARESFIDELAAAAGVDPLEFRRARLSNERIRAVLQAAAKGFDWSRRVKKVTDSIGVGLACGTEKGSVVAACVEVEIDRKRGAIKVNEVCEAFECGPVQNPDNLISQIQGCIIMGLGAVLREAIEFENGQILNADFDGYRVPRFTDVPKINVRLVENTKIDSAGGGETPIMAIAPAVGNAIFAATGIRLRSIPMQAEKLIRS